jgi:RNA polymerase sigma-B factor
MPAGQRPSRHELIERNLGLARSLARRYSGRGEPDDDLVQVAVYGLIRAVDRFDPAHGAAFTTFAQATILGELKHHFRGTRWQIHVSRSLQEHYLRTRASTDVLLAQLGRSPTLAEVAEHAALSVEQVVEAMEAGASFRMDSLDAGSDEGGVAYALGAEDAGFAEVETRNELGHLIARLPARERQIVRLRFVDELPQHEIAARIGHSQMHVSRLLARSLAKLRAWADDEDAVV